MHEFRHGSSPPTGSGRICLPAFDVMTSTLTMESPERALHDQFDQSLDALMEGDFCGPAAHAGVMPPHFPTSMNHQKQLRCLSF
jgi:hypothetical protein